MQIGVPLENLASELRVALVPASVDRLVKKGFKVVIEKGLGQSIHIQEDQYLKSGAEIADNHNSILADSDIILRIRKPGLSEISLLKKGSIHISFLDPFNEKGLIEAFVRQGVSAVSMEMIPRSTIAQKMDALSSQANLAGYAAVILAAQRSQKIFPMMMTPSGTITPARVFVIGAGVAGLQAIATAKRLGARVEAFDTRPIVKEQVQSLGAKFIEVDLGETGQTKDGYAKALTPEQLEKQREAMTKVCSQSDVVITTAQLFGRKAPIVITKEMVHQMKPGSIIVDMAVESGGNVEGSQLDKEVEISGVRILGLSNLPGRVAVHASQMYSSNLVNLLETYWEKDQGFVLKADDDILKACLITHEGKISNSQIRDFYQKQGV